MFFNNIRSVWKDTILRYNDGVDTFETLLRLGDRIGDNVWKRDVASVKIKTAYIQQGIMSSLPSYFAFLFSYQKL
jgi:hypothetical protein